MDGFLLVNKEKDYTSRDVVNIVSRHLNIKKVGHTGTLDPMATGLLILCVGKGTKLIDVMTSEEKEYIAEITLGIKTDTGDITGDVLAEENVVKSEEEIKKVLKNMTKEYEQTVPIYSAIKIKGKKLYEYAREKKEIELPKRLVKIKKLELISSVEIKNNKTVFKVKCLVSKGTYIRSLVEDIAEELNTIGTMSSLNRTKIGWFSLDHAYSLYDIKNNHFKINPIVDFFDDKLKIKVDDKNFLFKIKNGNKIKNTYNKKEVLFVDENNNALALYTEDKKNNNVLKVNKMFI